MRRGVAILVFVLFGAPLLWSPPVAGAPRAASAAARKAPTKTPTASKRKKRATPKARKPTRKAAPAKRKATPIPTPTPPQFLRAAGACLDYHPGQFIVLAEPGGQGRAIQIDSATELSITPERGARVRVLYKEGPEGPIAKKILAGPEEKPPSGN